jgi:DNA-binding transcriptional LysR family regulator
VDLNLLTALDVLLEEGSVGRAAARLHLTQPAVSRALGRIRRATGDEILVRAGREMVPTPYAEQVRDEVRALVARATAVLSPTQALDLASLDRVFTLRCHDAVTTALAPALIARARHVAPQVRFRFLAEFGDDLPPGLRDDPAGLRRVTDLEVGATADAGPDVRARQIGAGRLVGVLRRGHPALEARTALDVRAYAGLDHVIVSRRGRLTDPVDVALEQAGLARTVVAAVPTSTAALHLVAQTDHTTVVSAEACRGDIDALDLVTYTVPVDLPVLPLVLRWHRRHDRDPAHRWLRTATEDVLGARAARDTTPAVDRRPCT